MPLEPKTPWTTPVSDDLSTYDHQKLRPKYWWEGRDAWKIADESEIAELTEFSETAIRRLNNNRELAIQVDELTEANHEFGEYARRTEKERDQALTQKKQAEDQLSAEIREKELLMKKGKAIAADLVLVKTEYTKKLLEHGRHLADCTYMKMRRKGRVLKDFKEADKCDCNWYTIKLELEEDAAKLGLLSK